MGAVVIQSAIGLRQKQEDRIIDHEFDINGVRGRLLGVLDGHDGAAAVDHCAKHLPKHFAPHHIYDVQDALRRSIKKLADETRAMKGGTTLSVVCLIEDHDFAVAAVLGDSPVIMRNVAGSVWISPVHNVGSNVRERNAAIARGAIYSKDGYIGRHGCRDSIQLSRALGDKALRPILSDVPDLFTMRMPEFVLIMTDGIIDLGEEESSVFHEAHQVADAGGFHPSLGIIRLFAWREERGPLNDNATAIIWRKNILTV